jgi:hypothetical protein
MLCNCLPGLLLSVNVKQMAHGSLNTAKLNQLNKHRTIHATRPGNRLIKWRVLLGSHHNPFQV